MRNEQSRHMPPCPNPLTATTKEIEAYEVRLKHVLDEGAFVREAELREQEAFEEGHQAEKEIIARRLLQTGMDVKEINKITELGEKRILEMQQETRNE